MRKIWKYGLELTDKPQAIEMPQGAEIVFVAGQAGILCLWAIVVPDSPMGVRRFVVHGTGHPVYASARTYVGTAQIGPGVWHVFEI